jgi:hypothetical protein
LIFFISADETEHVSLTRDEDEDEDEDKDEEEGVETEAEGDDDDAVAAGEAPLTADELLVRSRTAAEEDRGEESVSIALCVGRVAEEAAGSTEAADDDNEEDEDVDDVEGVSMDCGMSGASFS